MTALMVRPVYTSVDNMCTGTWTCRGMLCSVLSLTMLGDYCTDGVASFCWSSVMVGGTIFLTGKKTTSMATKIERYQYKICNQWQSHISKVWDQTILKHNNTHLHKAGLSATTSRIREGKGWDACQQFWPQHHWTLVYVRVTNRTTLVDLQWTLVEERDSIPQQTGMKKRCQAVEAVCSSSTLYWGSWLWNEYI